jgi:hypothetical protein
VLPKQKLTSYESALTSLLFAIIALILEVVFVYQYLESGVVKFSPTAMIKNDGAFYFIIIMGLFTLFYTPYAVNRFRQALSDDD